MEQHLKIFWQLPSVLAKLWADSFPAKAIGAFFGGMVGYLFPSPAAYAAACGAAALICVDTVTGFWAAIVTGKKVSSAKFVRVITKIIGYGSCVIVAAVATKSTGTDHIQGALVTGVGVFVIATEGISILENVAKMGLEPPTWLLNFLRARKKDNPTQSKED